MMSTATEVGGSYYTVASAGNRPEPTGTDRARPGVRPGNPLTVLDDVEGLGACALEPAR